MLTDITVIILTFNEEIHIERAILSALNFTKPNNIIIVDSFSTDNTINICNRLGVRVYQRAFISHSDQFNWVLDNNVINSDWIMKLDADEYCDKLLTQEILYYLPKISNDFAAVEVKLNRSFQGKKIRFGTSGIRLVRIFRKGRARLENRVMDEHVIFEGNLRKFSGGIWDDNLKPLSFWINKHVSYAEKEFIAFQEESRSDLSSLSAQARHKRLLKKYYYLLPGVSGPLLYFFYRYVIRLGFLDGYYGFLWHFLQGFWYRVLVNEKIKRSSSHKS